MPLKCDTKKAPFCMSSNKFLLKCILKDNHWVWNLVMKPIDAMAFQKRKSMMEVNNDKINNIPRY